MKSPVIVGIRRGEKFFAPTHAPCLQWQPAWATHVAEPGNPGVGNAMKPLSTVGANNYSPLHRCLPDKYASKPDDYNASSPRQNRRSIRLRGYDYSQAGAYFVTLCTHNRQCLFGEMVDGKMQLNEAGRVVENCWNDIPLHFPHVELDEWVIMPNHVHGILSIAVSPDVGAKNFSPLQCSLKHQSAQRPCGTSKTIGSIVRGFKIGVTKWLRNNTPIHDVWQRNYWEHIIRNEPELHHIREYIHNNPAQWELDRLYIGRGEKFFAPTEIRESSAQYATEAWMV